MTFLKSIFSKGANQNKSIQPLSDNFTRHVQKAILLLTNNKISLPDNEFHQSFIDKGINLTDATEILLFLPIAFVRHLLPAIQWHHTYYELISDKKQIEIKYSETKAFQIIWAVTVKYFNDSPSSESIIKIAGRSSEFRSINELLLNEKDLKLEEIKLTKTIIIR